MVCIDIYTILYSEKNRFIYPVRNCVIPKLPVAENVIQNDKRGKKV